MSISIHALRVEGDLSSLEDADATDISIHALRVEGDFLRYSLLPATQISIHALRVEGDVVLVELFPRCFEFYPRPPGGGRPARLYRGVLISRISIHALRVEGDIENAGRTLIA